MANAGADVRRGTLTREFTFPLPALPYQATGKTRHYEKSAADGKAHALRRSQSATDAREQA